MKMKNASLQGKLVRLLTLALVLTLATLIADHMLSDNLVKKETVYQYQNLLDERVKRLDDALEAEGVSMVLFANNNAHIGSLKRAENTEDFYFSTLRAKRDMDVLALSSLSNAAFFLRYNDETTYCGISRYSALSAYESRDLERYIKGTDLDEVNTKNRWKLVHMGDSWFFLYGFTQRDCAFGLCLEVEQLLNSLGLEVNGQSSLAMFSGQEEMITNSETFSTADIDENVLLAMDGATYYDNSNFIVSSYAQNLERPIYYIRENTFSNNLKNSVLLLRVVTLIIAIVYFLTTIGGYYSIYKPLWALKSRISDVRDGQLKTTIEILPTTPREFAETYQLFNEMIHEIENLKISSYEMELEKQKSEIQFLSMQIEPHFYLNSMKYLYALAQRKQYSTVQEILIRLSNYFRYLTYDSQKLVALSEEIQHTKDYLSIVTSGVQSKMKISMAVAQEAENMMVPKLFVQTFVENAVKYAVKDDGSLNAAITADVIGTDDPYLSMMIRDDGNGFAEEYLDGVKESGFVLSDNHVGLSNLYHRLLLIFGEKIYMNVSNQDGGGALIEVMIPALKNVDELLGGKES